MGARFRQATARARDDGEGENQPNFRTARTRNDEARPTTPVYLAPIPPNTRPHPTVQETLDSLSAQTSGITYSLPTSTNTAQPITQPPSSSKMPSSSSPPPPPTNQWSVLGATGHSEAGTEQPTPPASRATARDHYYNLGREPRRRSRLRQFAARAVTGPLSRLGDSLGRRMGQRAADPNPEVAADIAQVVRRSLSAGQEAASRQGATSRRRVSQEEPRPAVTPAQREALRHYASEHQMATAGASRLALPRARPTTGDDHGGRSWPLLSTEAARVDGQAVPDRGHELEFACRGPPGAQAEREASRPPASLHQNAVPGRLRSVFSRGFDRIRLGSSQRRASEEELAQGADRPRTGRRRAGPPVSFAGSAADTTQRGRTGRRPSREETTGYEGLPFDTRRYDGQAFTSDPAVDGTLGVQYQRPTTQEERVANVHQGLAARLRQRASERHMARERRVAPVQHSSAADLRQQASSQPPQSTDQTDGQAARTHQDRNRVEHGYHHQTDPACPATSDLAPSRLRVPQEENTGYDARLVRPRDQERHAAARGAPPVSMRNGRSRRRMSPEDDEGRDDRGRAGPRNGGRRSTS